MGQKQSLLFAAEKGDFRDSLADLDAFSLYNTFAFNTDYFNSNSCHHYTFKLSTEDKYILAASQNTAA